MYIIMFIHVHIVYMHIHSSLCTCTNMYIITKPMQTYNGDETGVTIVFKLGKIGAELRQRNVYSVSAAERLKTHTILSCVSACGFVLPPMMIYPCKGRCLPQHSFFFASSETGWINAQL